MSQRSLMGLLVSVLVVRLVSLGLYPLIDSTEARYAAIARTMAELGDWITPWFPNGAPFWGKPPLAFWASGLSFRIFGVNEFAARLPHWLMAVIVLVLVRGMMARWSHTAALYAVAVLAGSLLFFLLAGTVTTDMALLLAVTMALRGFWLGLHGETDRLRWRESMMLFVGLGLGLLAKGPLVLVLVLTPILVWTLVSREWTRVRSRLPWLRGLLITLMIAAPWYLWAELRTPGFLRYFIVGEHIMRFLVPGWEGDLYGNAHDEVYGTIWLYLVLGLLPWTLLLPLLALRRRDWPSRPTPLGGASGRFLLIGGLTPAVFFSFSSNILPTYVLPGLPPLSMLAGAWLSEHRNRAIVQRVLALGLIASVAVPGAVLLQGMRSGRIEERTEKYLVRAYEQRRTGSRPLLYVGDRPFSAAFYTRGDARQVDALGPLLDGDRERTIFVAVPRGDAWGPQLPREAERIHTSGDFILYRVPGNDG